MRIFCCASCGTRQDPKLDLNSKTNVACKRCGKPLYAKRDKSGVMVKAYDDEPP